MAGGIDGEIHSKMAKRHWFKKTIRKYNPILQRKSRMRWLREIEIMMIMMNMYIINSWIKHLQEADDILGDGVGWLGDIWGVILYFLSIV